MLAAVFVALFRKVQQVAATLPGPRWIRPALGGLLLGIFCTPIILIVANESAG